MRGTNCVQPGASWARNWRGCLDPVPPRGFGPPGDDRFARLHPAMAQPGGPFPRLLRIDDAEHGRPGRSGAHDRTSD